MDSSTWTPFGARLRRFRVAAGLTQAMLAERSGMSERAINDLERDQRRTPRLETIMLLGKALGLSDGDRKLLLAAARPNDVESAPSTQPFSPASSLAHIDSLPKPTSSFVGRKRELHEICGRLREPEVRLLTLTGPGGIGKTRLALRIGETMSNEYADGVRFVELGSINDPKLVLPKISAALGITASTGTSEGDRVIDVLRSRELLLMLDNFEQVTVAATDLNVILTACPQVKVLVTSRAPLHLVGEQEYPVPPLSLRYSTHAPDSDEMLTNDAVALFAQRAHAVQPTFSLTRANAETIAAICQRLDGMPLAIELAAARIKLLQPASLLSRLDQQLTVLTGGPQDAPARQRTVRAAIDWSFNLLSAIQQTLFRRLAVFIGGWTLEAAEGICAGDGLETSDIFDLLADLVDQSIVVVGEQDGAARYRLIEPIRQYAEEKLLNAGESAALNDRHLTWFYQFAKGINAQMWLMPTPQSLALQPEADNIRAALTWSKQDPSGQTELTLLGELTTFWPLLDAIREGRQTLRDALDRADSSMPSPGRARARFVAASLAAIETEPLEAFRLMTEAIADFEALGDEVFRTKALVMLARAQYWMGNLTDYERLRDQSLSLCRELADRRALAQTLWLLGDIAQELADTTTARMQLEECIRICRELDDTVMLAYPLITLARVECEEGTFDAARALVEEAIQLRATAPVWAQAIALISLGEVERCAGNDARALTLFDDALTIFRERGHRANYAWALHNLAHMNLRAHDWRKANASFKEALVIRQKNHYAYGIASELIGLASVNMQSGDLARAARLFGAGQTVLYASHSHLAPADAIDCAGDLSALRDALGEDAFASELAVGSALTLEQALTEALNGAS